MDPRPLRLLSEQDVRRIHIDILRELTGHEPPPPTGAPDPAAQSERRPPTAAHVIALALAAR